MTGQMSPERIAELRVMNAVMLACPQADLAWSTAFSELLDAIEASSDLLAALEDAREEIAMRAQEDGGDQRSVTKACAKYDAAIAKARGE